MHGGEALGLQAEVTSQKSAEQKETTDDLNLKCADFFFPFKHESLHLAP